jgi:DNA-binding MarR family transcriptional regulator
MVGTAISNDLTAGEALRLITLLNRVAISLVQSGGALGDSRMKVLRRLQSAGRNGSTQATIADDLDLSRPALSRICDELEQDRLITRESHQFDRRRKTLRLTEQGVRQLEVCGQVLNAAAATATVSMSRRDIGLLTALLETVDRNLSAETSVDPVREHCSTCPMGGC